MNTLLILVVISLALIMLYFLKIKKSSAKDNIVKEEEPKEEPIEEPKDNMVEDNSVISSPESEITETEQDRE
jgi:uncharacterized ion transporter superfamily protein YfcC